MAKPKMRLPELGSFQTIKFGSGVLGKTSPLVGGIIVLAGIAVTVLRNADPYLIGGLFAATLLSVAAYIIYSFWYGVKYTAEALLEGGELIRYRELAIASNDPTMIDVTPETTPNVPPPSNLGAGGHQ